MKRLPKGREVGEPLSNESMHTREGLGQHHSACREGRCLRATPLSEGSEVPVQLTVSQIELTPERAMAESPRPQRRGLKAMALLAIVDKGSEHQGRGASDNSGNVPQVSDASVHAALGAPCGEIACSSLTIGDMHPSRTDDACLPAVCKVTEGPRVGVPALTQPLFVTNAPSAQGISDMRERHDLNKTAWGDGIKRSTRRQPLLVREPPTITSNRFAILSNSDCNDDIQDAGEEDPELRALPSDAQFQVSEHCEQCSNPADEAGGRSNARHIGDKPEWSQRRRNRLGRPEKHAAFLQYLFRRTRRVRPG